MFILKSSLYSQEKWNQRLIKYYQNGYEIRSVHKHLIIMSKQQGSKYYFNVTPPNTNGNVHTIASNDTFEAFISRFECEKDNVAIGKYYEWLIERHNNTTFKLLIPIVFLIVSYDFIPKSIQSLFALVITSIFLIAFARNLKRKSFIKAIVKPHNLQYKLDNEILNNVYIVKSKSPLSNESLELFKNCGKILKVNAKDGYYNYKLDSILERTEILNFIKESNQKMEVFSTINQS